MPDSIFLDGFETYATADIPLRWTVNSGSPTIQSTGGRNNTGHLYLNSASVTKTIAHSSDTVSILFAFLFTGFQSSGRWFQCASNWSALWCELNYQNALLRCGAGSLASAWFGPLIVNTWNTLEIQLKIASTGGYLKVRLNGVEVYSATGNTLNSNTTSLQDLMWNPQYGSWLRLDDLVFAYGGPKALDYIGDLHVVGVQINGDGTVGLTKGGSSPAASNYQSVNALTGDGDTTYVYSAVAGTQDLYNVANPGIAGNLFALQLTSVARKDDAVTRVMRNILKSGGNQYEGADRGLPLGYAAFSDCWLTNPANGQPWTSASMPQVGVKLQV